MAAPQGKSHKAPTKGPSHIRAVLPIKGPLKKSSAPVTKPVLPVKGPLRKRGSKLFKPVAPPSKKAS